MNVVCVCVCIVAVLALLFFREDELLLSRGPFRLMHVITYFALTLILI